MWGADAAETPAKPLSNQQKKKNAAMSKKKFMEEVQTMAPPVLASAQDFPSIGLTELGQRLITEENDPNVTNVVKKAKAAPSPASQTNNTVENASTASPKKKKVSGRPNALRLSPALFI